MPVCVEVAVVLLVAVLVDEAVAVAVAVIVSEVTMTNPSSLVESQ
jgi:hypothetical protein